MRYSIDTSALLDGWVRYYPPDVFPFLWRNLETLIEEGHLRAADEVKVELEKKEDSVSEWAGRQSGLFVPIDQALQEALSEILSRFPRLVNTQRNRSLADPWVIALAYVHDCVVVTGERRSRTLDRPRIPDVCDEYGIESIPMLQLFRKEGWVFG